MNSLVPEVFSGRLYVGIQEIYMSNIIVIYYQNFLLKLKYAFVPCIASHIISCNSFSFSLPNFFINYI